MSTDEFREALAQKLYYQSWPMVGWQKCNRKGVWRERADDACKVELLPGITLRRAIEQIQAGKWVELDDDQEWPASPYKQYHRLRRREFDFSAAVNEGFSRSKAMAQRARFKRVSALSGETGD